MDRFDAMRVFARIVERRSFTLAAEDLGLPRSSVTDAVKGLEERLGVRLLQRTTRQVSPTLDGEAYYRRCVNLIADLEDAEGAFAGATPSGLIRVDVHGTQARHFLLPGLPDFFVRYPNIRLHLSESNQPLDMIREGLDCILRTGELSDSPWSRRNWRCSNGGPSPVRPTCPGTAVRSASSSSTAIAWSDSCHRTSARSVPWSFASETRSAS
jgi:DNA-binding transcriptional LysR family regulator